MNNETLEILNQSLKIMKGLELQFNFHYYLALLLIYNYVVFLQVYSKIVCQFDWYTVLLSIKT